MIQGTIYHGNTKQTVTANQGDSILAAVKKAGLILPSPCGGNGTCGKCKVTASGDLSPVGEDEKKFLSAKEIESSVRLACKAKINGDFTVTLPKEALEVETDFKTVSYTAKPMVYSVRGEEAAFYTLDGTCIDTAAKDSKNLGLAVDIGTTTVAVYLCDLDRCTVIGKRGFRNPQASYGADVISRIDKIMKNEVALREQQQLLIAEIGKTAKVLAETVQATEKEIRVAVFCGNTVMEHIAAGINPSSIANAPFIAPTLFGEEYGASDIGLSIFKDAKVYFAPCFASYVGGDIACGMIATGLDKASDNVLFIDVGTNGEIGLSTKKGLYFCSAAAGPAFEGAHITCGMAGTVGAVSDVRYQNGKMTYQTIGNVAPVGICGSGIIDAVAAMLNMGILDETGCILDSDEVDDEVSAYVGEDDDGNNTFVIDREHNIYISGKDIREVQLAKSAIAAGILTLLEHADLKLSDITSVVLAGGFGSHIHPENACRIGLIPRCLDGKIISCGNTAGAGACAVLLGSEPRASASTICGKSTYIELSGDAFFMDTYIDEMMFEEE